MMKTLAVVAVAGALASPALTFAQSSNEPVTRAQVRADLVQMEQAGYNPASSDNVHYPTDVQAAEARVSGQDEGQLTNNAMGGVEAGSSASGAPEAASYRTQYNSAYPSNTRSGTWGSSTQCQGPSTFCNVYSGGR